MSIEQIKRLRNLHISALVAGMLFGIGTLMVMVYSWYGLIPLILGWILYAYSYAEVGPFVESFDDVGK